MADVDLLITGGTVIDGSGALRRRADVAVRGAQVVALAPPGALAGARAAQVIDATGQIVAPGFIDTHTHDDRLLRLAPAMPAKLSQGVTTVVTGNCGMSLAPWRPVPGQAVPGPLNLLSHDPADFAWAQFGDWLDALEAAPAAVNAACLVGHTTLRAATMDRLDRAATPAELAAMRALLAQALDAGALGLSTGAAYPNAAAATEHEMASLAEVMRERGGVYASHIRDEADAIVPALDEALAIARAGAVPLVVSHHKLIGPANHGRSRETLAHLEGAALRQPLALDCYPYTAGSTILRRDRLAVSSRVIVTASQPHPEFAGMDLADIAMRMGLTPEAACDALQPASATYFLMDEADVRRILAWERTMIGSDGLPHDSRPHPRLWGSFPRVLGHYARDVGLFPLETAVHKMTGLPAAHFGLAGRGRVAEGAWADLVVFDAATVADAATYDEPTRPARGIDCVCVNGRIAWQGGAPTGERPGRVLRRAR